MQLVAVVAIAGNNVIGREGQVPWKLGSDMRHFRHLTMNHPVIMGRKTWESLKQPLVGRDNIVVTRTPDYHAEGGHVVPSLEAARKIARDFATMRGVKEIMIIGGAKIYEQMLPHTGLLHVTEVHATLKGDTFFPKIDPKVWRETSRVRHTAGRKDEFDYSFVTYERIANSAGAD